MSPLSLGPVPRPNGVNYGVHFVLRPLRSDLLLVHAPAVFEFRGRRDIYFPFLGTSGDVPITPLYEYFPVGFKTLQRFLGDRGHDVKLLNLASLLVRYPHLDIQRIFEALDTKVVGIDLHWMIHVQGALEIAERLKAARPDIAILFGGISSTYYADELIRYPFVDMVMRGYDTHEPLDALLRAMDAGTDLGRVPNLLYKENGAVKDGGFSYKPDSFACGIDWSQQPRAPKTKGLPIREILSTQNAGCAYNCPWCGGSRDAFRRIFGKKRAMARKPDEEIRFEIDTMKRLDGVSGYHFYSVGSYNESASRLGSFLDELAGTQLKSVSFEQFHLTPPDVLDQMVKLPSKVSITLSPESHDPHIAKLSGRGVYTNEEMEGWIEEALGKGIHSIDVWYFVGMPEQTEKSVMETIDYASHLLQKFKGLAVNPMVCPMIPFLDPASNIFEDPASYGYRVFYRTAEEHRRGMERASIIHRMNYETKWLPREQLVRTGYLAIRRLMQEKANSGMLPGGAVNRYNEKIDDALRFVAAVHEADSVADPSDRAKALASLGDEIERRNHAVLFAGVANQALPINRQIGGRWFDELGWDPEELDRTVGDGV
ncbi:MAG: radical SAM protein [Polyangiaceae bacterium]|nr:radical SAM protein [Polyangiaceae bacterium]